MSSLLPFHSQKISPDYITLPLVEDSLNQPLSFQDWFAQTKGIAAGQEYLLYNRYVREWYQNHQSVLEKQPNFLKEKYKKLLRQIQLFFSREDQSQWFTNVDLDSQRELAIAIPYFAKKLKEIAFYYQDLRTAGQNAKLKYSLIGSQEGLEKLLYEYILQAFTRQGETITVSKPEFWNYLPALSSISPKFKISIEELYDDNDYFDANPQVPLSAYFDLSHENLLEISSLTQIPLSSIEWIYSTGFQPLCSNYYLENFEDFLDTQFIGNSSFQEEIYGPQEVYNVFNQVLLTQKYLGENAYLLQGGNRIADIIPVTVEIEQGSNTLFYPQGSVQTQVDTTKNYVPMTLNDLRFIESQATAGVSPSSSDQIYINTQENEVLGAWLKLGNFNKVHQFRSEFLPNYTTIFRYPFPNYGVSAENIPYSGPGIDSYKSVFHFLKEDSKKSISDAYWTLFPLISTVPPLSIHSTSLIDQGAKAGKDINNADVIRIREGNPSEIYQNNVYSGNEHIAWLYKFQQTDIPLRSGDTNLIYWPIKRLENSSERIPFRVSVDNTAEVTPIQDTLDTEFSSGFIAGSSINDSTAIYHLKAPGDPLEEALDVAWLGGDIREYEIIDDSLDTTPPFLNTTTSLSGYTISVRYSNSEGPCPGGHQCDAAIFDLFANNVYIGTANLNNSLDGGDRQAVFVINQQQANAVGTGSVQFSLVCNPNHPEYNPNDGWGNNCHQPIGWVQIWDADGNEIYNDCAVGNFFNFFVYVEEIPVEEEIDDNISRPPVGDFPSKGFHRSQVSKQLGLNFYVPPGGQSSFIWQGTECELKTIFQYTPHSKNCPYGKDPNVKNLSLLDNPDSDSFQKCTCKNYYRSPFGHPGGWYDAYRGLADIIVADFGGPEEFNLSTWRDVDGLSYQHSPYFAYFRLYGGNTLVEKDIGWSPGYWARWDGEPTSLLLKEGWRYRYVRVKLNDLEGFPGFQCNTIKNHRHGELRWYGATKDKTQNRWKSSVIPSRLKLIPGDYYAIVQPKSWSYNIIQTVPLPPEEQELRQKRSNSIWTQADYLALGETALITYPQRTIIDLDQQQSRDGQYPPINVGELSAAFWSVSSPSGWEYYVPVNLTAPFRIIGSTNAWGSLSGTTIPQLDLGFVITEPGIYNIAVTAYQVGSDEPIIINTIPPVTGFDPQLTLTQQITTVKVPVPNSRMRIPLYGWDYSQNRRTNSKSYWDYVGARPFWAQGLPSTSNQRDYENKEHVFDDYVLIEQPPISPLVLQSDTYFEYVRKDTRTLVWTENLEYQIPGNYLQWTLLGTENEPADITLQPGQNIRYEAQKAFTWNYELTALALGIPPEGGKIVPLSTINLVTELVEPWKNLLNRHFPTIATAPYLGNLQSEKQIGYYFLGSKVATSVYLGNNPLWEYDANTNEKIYINPHSYNKGNRGISHSTLEIPISSFGSDNQWFKCGVETGIIAGNIDTQNRYPVFLGYQTQYESNNQHQIGLVHPKSSYTPWGGIDGLQWADTLNYPLNFKGDFNIDKWLEDQTLKTLNKTLWQWGTDIFGNQYGLYKDIENIPYALQPTLSGDFYVRLESGRVYTASNALSSLYQFFATTSLYNELTSSNIKEINVYFDTLFIQTSSYLAISKLKYDYNNRQITTTLEGIHHYPIITYNQSYKSIPEPWFNPSVKSVWFVLNNIWQPFGIIYPEIYELNLNNNQVQLLWPLDSEYQQLSSLETLSLSSIRYPTISYDDDSKKFNICYMSDNSLVKNILVNMDFDVHGEQFTLSDLRVVLPLSAF